MAVCTANPTQTNTPMPHPPHAVKKTTPVPRHALQKIKTWWTEHRHCLLLPPAYAGHAHDWQTLDLDCAVCRLCGVPHLCKHPDNIVPCSAMHDQHETVCTVTGVVLSNTTFNDSTVSVENYQKEDGGQDSYSTDRHTESQSTDVLLKKTWEAIDLLLYSGIVVVIYFGTSS